MAGNISMMAAFAARLEQQAKTDPNIRVLTADLVGSCALKGMERDCPGQFINVGIAEQNMVGIAAGLAHEGMRPYTYTFAVFHSMRACEQVRTDVFYNGLNVKVIGTHCGISTGFAGSTHFALEDIGIIRSMPASVILVPADPVSAEKTADVAYGFDRGMYIRLDRNPLPVLYPPEAVFEIGKAKVLRDGKDVVLFAIGAAVHSALEAAEEIPRQLRLRSLSGTVLIDFINMRDKEQTGRLMSELQRGFREDPVRTQVIDVTRLNITEVTRQKVRKPLWEQVEQYRCGAGSVDSGWVGE